MSIRRIVRAAVLLPGMAAVVIPALILYSSGTAEVGWSLAFPLLLVLIVISGGLIVIGLFMLTWTVLLFARVGRGTLAPWDSPEKLVITGPYRQVRNPMISAVFFIVLGEAALFGSAPLFYWFALFVAINATYIPLLEEPGLASRFGEDYRRYKQHVPRWIPRLQPWKPELEQTGPDA